MKPRARMVPLVLGLLLLRGSLSASEEPEPAKAPKTRMHRQLNQVLRRDAGLLPPATPAVEPEAAEVAPGTLELEPMVIEEKPKDMPLKETKAEKFFRTGTLWEKVGPKFTRQFWFGRSRGMGFTISW